MVSSPSAGLGDSEDDSDLRADITSAGIRKRTKRLWG